MEQTMNRRAYNNSKNSATAIYSTPYLAAVVTFMLSLLLLPMLTRAQRLPVNRVGSSLPDSISWFPFAAFPAPVRLAVIAGDPTIKGPYVVRVKVPAGVKLLPHIHPEDRIYTILSGVFYIGLGTSFDDAKLMAFPPGAVFILPGNTPHFHWAKSGEYVSQVTATGPLGISYVNPADDPRNH
ncbi:cupin domain-containing protein [Paraflavitalea pollutisoli]|uniref:cupin domain-containing protein n=1 Tax=Paraflavitalea pollutisoli TaxID=3034143 RepID=UPI0023ECE75A|nr:cupin domain-containing protein [Paraflavitalea sp. H1-2-19X]